MSGIIDLYCERTGAGLWNEPLNAISNLSFVLAAFLAWRAVQLRGFPDLFEKLCIFLAGMIGIGSFLFHTFANSWTELADVIPIWSFVAVYISATIYRATNENKAKTLLIAAIAAVIMVCVLWFTGNDIATDADAAPSRFNGSLQYAPAVIALAIFTILTQIKRHPARNYIAAAFVTFFVSLVFRTIDLDTCAALPIGTHFAWHLLNGLMVGLLLQALVLKMPPLSVGASKPL
ncbi:ceramidase domain-containing protein [Cochlodiniinecator piscidefendens]|uniref:ceramidase domain-containing protein n=1 Tax=Cochlodiniinecator piscidefendens TaxID=2715756 RepID=UPI001409A72E|nr:ceramidase domain-containing protein [Cochlodiniinecator piscidefendens]